MGRKSITVFVRCSKKISATVATMATVEVRLCGSLSHDEPARIPGNLNQPFALALPVDCNLLLAWPAMHQPLPPPLPRGRRDMRAVDVIIVTN